MSFGQMRQNSSSLAKDIGYVCRKKGDVCNPKHTVLTPNYGDAAASVEVGNLIMVDEIMKKEGNVKILTGKTHAVHSKSGSGLLLCLPT